MVHKKSNGGSARVLMVVSSDVSIHQYKKPVLLLTFHERETGILSELALCADLFSILRANNCEDCCPVLSLRWISET
ncbi:unnamed protein product [Sphagnum jensenii]|uniref:Uncharacterized protein n=1 Tax=Sphagnum jensenii TaxID=128206 RepID=A0ABP1A482_9BRYO